ncbi:MAG: dihydropteroate synthase [Blastocatellia bacterium]
MKRWITARRILALERPLIMGVLNVTPDSFSDGGRFNHLDAALQHVEKMLAAGSDIIDVGGESSRPGSQQITADEEINRVEPIISAIAKRWDTPISVDTWKADVAAAAIDAGAEIINDISGLRFDPRIAEIAAQTKAGLILMHSRGSFRTMHFEPPMPNIVTEVVRGLRNSITAAQSAGIANEQIALDVGIGFGKTPEQNLELIADLNVFRAEFSEFPIVVGASRKSFIGKLTGELNPEKRLAGSLAAAAIAVYNGADFVRVHDVAESREAAIVAHAIKRAKRSESSI